MTTKETIKVLFGAWEDIPGFEVGYPEDAAPSESKVTELNSIAVELAQLAKADRQHQAVHAEHEKLTTIKAAQILDRFAAANGKGANAKAKRENGQQSAAYTALSKWLKSELKLGVSSSAIRKARKDYNDANPTTPPTEAEVAAKNMRSAVSKAATKAAGPADVVAGITNALALLRDLCVVAGEPSKAVEKMDDDERGNVLAALESLEGMLGEVTSEVRAAFAAVDAEEAEEDSTDSSTSDEQAEAPAPTGTDG